MRVKSKPRITWSSTSDDLALVGAARCLGITHHRTSITPRFHLLVNALLLLAGLQVGFLRDHDLRAHAGAVPPAHALAWLTLVALLFSNAIWRRARRWVARVNPP